MVRVARLDKLMPRVLFPPLRALYVRSRYIETTRRLQRGTPLSE